MKKTVAWLLAALLLCSVSGVTSLAAGDEICGTWYMVDLDDGSGKDYSELLVTMASLGMYATLEIREDGSATIDLFDETEDFTVDFEAGEVVFEDNRIKYTLADGTLSFSDDDTSMTFSRSLPSSGTAAGNRVFDYYEYVDMKDYDGTVSDTPKDPVNLVIFEDGTGLLTSGARTLELVFDFDREEITSEGKPMGDFTLKKDILTIDDGEHFIRFRLGDPGWAGPYTLTAMVDSDGKDMSEQLSTLALLNMVPTLTVSENGEGVLELMGEETKLSFDFDKMLVSSEDEDKAISFSYENGVLTMESDGNSMTFRRVMPAAADEEAPDEEAPDAEEKDPDERDPSQKG